MAVRKDTSIAFPVNTNLEDMVFHYLSLFNAHGVKHSLPNCTSPYNKLTKGVKEAQDRLLLDFQKVNDLLWKFKNEYGDVEVADMKVTGNSVRISFILGK